MRGMVLIVTLVFLMIFSILLIAVQERLGWELKITQHYADYHIALGHAESLLRIVENNLKEKKAVRDQCIHSLGCYSILNDYSGADLQRHLLIMAKGQYHHAVVSVEALYTLSNKNPILVREYWKEN